MINTAGKNKATWEDWRERTSRDYGPVVWKKSKILKEGEDGLHYEIELAKLT